MTIAEEKTIRNYWTKKTKGLSLISNQHLDISDNCSLFLEKQKLAYFSKLTAGNEITEYTVLVTLFVALLQRYFETGNQIFSYGLGQEPNVPVLFLFENIEKKELKQYLLEARKEVQEVYSYTGHGKTEDLLTLHTYSSFEFSYNNAHASAPLPFKLAINKNDQGLEMNISFSETFIDKHLATSFLENIKSWITHLEECLQLEIVKIPIISEAEKQVVLGTFNNPTSKQLDDATIVSLFEKQVALTPHDIACEYNGKVLSYSSLNEEANKLAHYLREERGVVSQDFVGVKLLRSEKLLIALLAILKTGSAYVPIDVDYPEERIAFIEKDSHSKLLLDEEEWDRFQKKQHNYSEKNIQNVSKADDLAYIIYTSGTTGNPKGVMIAHQNAVAMIQWAQKEFDATLFDVVYAATSICFDLSVYELFYTLSIGKKIRLLQNALEIGKFLPNDQHILLNTVPSSMRKILEEKHDLKNVRAINLAGEPFPVDLANKLLNYNIEIRNLYGPSEDTTYSTCYKLSRGKDYRSIPIGKPISNSQAYILGEGFQPLPVGVPGKLYVAGAGVAKGYLNRPDLTKERFIGNPFIPESRMYDTGDIAKWLPDGNIAFLGRKDHQVKLRGYRIELGEIESVLSKYSKDIRQAVAEVKQIGNEDVLVAYFIAGNTINKAELKNYLRERLPSYMVPGHYMELATIPLTPNGKIDRKALPEVTGDSVIRKDFIAPATHLEKELVDIWQGVLGLDKIGVTDDFFELGGHSLMVGQVVNIIYQKLNKSLTTKAFFENPSVRGISQKIRDTAYTPITKVPESLHYPITPAQHRLWVLSQLEGGSLAYNMPGSVVLHGELDIPNFEKSFINLIHRHEILRTYFKEDDTGEIHQYILPAFAFHFNLEKYDLSTNKKEEINDRLKAYIDSPFNLESAPLLRAALFSVEKQKHLFVLSMHHLISDGWSMELIVSEVIQSYNRSFRGEALNLPDLTIQYKDYTGWLGEQLNNEKHKASEKYWLSNFQGEIPVLDLPVFKKRPRIQTYNGRTITHKFSESFLNKIKEFSKANNATFFMTLMAGVNALLYRYSYQNDIIIGTPIAGREHPDLEHQIGLYLNTLAIRTVFEETDSFSNLIRKQRDILLSAYEHQNYPFDKLVNQLNLKRDTSRAALFDVMVLLQNHTQLNTIKKEDGLSGIAIEPYPIERNSSQFDLSLTFVENQALELSIEYNTDIYVAFQIERIFTHFENLVGNAIDNPELKIKAIRFISIHEEKQLIKGFNNQFKAFSTDKTITDIFEAQVLKTPQAAAVVFQDKVLTYEQLNEQANQLASYLRKKYQIKADDLIAIQLDRNEKLLVAIFGILKSGAAYVPIDVNYPPDRIEYIKADSNCKITLDEAELSAFEDVKERFKKENLQKNNGPQDLAYVIYTSGTTGNPKGVMVEHRNVVSIYEDWKKEYHLDQFDINLLQLASVSFDVFVGDICRSLLNGGMMVITSDDIKINPEQLYGLMEKHRVSICEGTPGLVLPLLDHILKDSKDYGFLKLVILGSDSFNNKEYNDLKEAFGDNLRIVNSYGVTEATIDSTYYDDILTDFEGATPIGKPFSHTEIFILDSEKMLVPAGVYGELCIGGAGVSRGYFNKKELTESRFVKHPFRQEKVYATGDIARWLPDGNIEFLGRNDHQVKLRGYRIELGEIENAIAQFSEQVKRTVVLIKEVKGSKALVAYYSPEDTIDKAALREFLQKKLPEYMIPSFFVELEKFPLTPNGKIDRKALPSFTEDDLIRNTYVGAQTQVEKKLVEIWENVLGINNIGIADNFYELGGHSLKITRLRHLINQAFDIDVPFNDLFLKSTIQAQAELIENASKTIYEEISVLEPQADYELSSVQRRIWILSQFEGSSTVYNMPAVFLLKGNLNSDALEKAFDTIIMRHESLRTIFKQYDTGEIRQIVLLPGECNFRLFQEDVSGLTPSDDKVQQIINKEVSYTFDLKNGPLLRAKLIKTEQTTLLTFVMHHIISDGWSIEIMTKELFSLYQAYSTNKNDALEPLSIQYKDYAAWEQAYLKSEKATVQREYWINQFQGEIPVLELPSTKKRPQVKTYSGRLIKKVIEKKDTRNLKNFCQANDSTLFMGILTLVKVLLYRYTGQKDIVIGTPIAGRNHASLQNQIGAYINTLALRTQLEGEYDFVTLLRKVKTNTLEAFEHQAYPFDKLVEGLVLHRDMSRHPLFDVMVALQNTGNSLSEIQKVNELFVEEFQSSEDVISKFDIEFTFEEVKEELQLTLIYNIDIFDREFAERLVEHFQSILKVILENPTTAVAVLPFLKESEERQLIHEFNNTTLDYPKEKTFLYLFENQVASCPQAIALMDGEHQFSYKDLDELSDNVAAYLVNNFDDQLPVGILLQRSSAMIAVLMGVMKAGQAYIPLDPTFPEDRLKYIITHSGITVLITESDYPETNNTGITAITADKILKETKNELTIKPKEKDTAYVIYTSGSTGNPKGVEIGHQSLLNFLLSMQKAPGFKNTDCLFAVTTYSFDISILEFFVPLITGASVFIAKNEVLSNPEELLHLLSKIKPTIIQATPSFYQMLLNAGWKGDRNLKVLCGGDTLHLALADKLLTSCGEVWNMYGPTETTIWSSIKKVEHPDHAAIIGRPIANTSMFVLNEFQQLQPKGATGNLYIGGDGLAKGYYKSENLTQQRFISNPFGEGKLYETGDVVKWNNENELVFLGRNDNQVKIRGYRIELSEVETKINLLPEIQQVVVTAKKDISGNYILVAYYIGDQGETSTTLRTKLKKLLPDYMIPSYFIRLEAFPLTPNKKIDKKALINLPDSQLMTPVNYVHPKSETEKKLVGLWQEVLGMEKIGVTDNFFDLGGHSMNATVLVSRIQHDFGVKFSIVNVFENPFIEDQAQLIENMNVLNFNVSNQGVEDELESFTI